MRNTGDLRLVSGLNCERIHCFHLLSGKGSYEKATTRNNNRVDINL